MSGRQAGALGVATVLIATVAAGAYYYSRPGTPPIQPLANTGETPETPEKVHTFCGNCHVYPPADTFPRFAWKEEVERGYFFFSKSNLKLVPPRIEEVIDYYESRAPEKLPPAEIHYAATPLPVKFAPHAFPDPPEASPPAVSHVSLVHLFDDQRLDILACEMRHGLIMSLSPYEKEPAWKILGKVKNPAHAEVVDFDGDGVRDILVADLGSFPPTDRRGGSVVWLKGSPDGSFAPFTLLEDVGRTADVQSVDLNGDGKLDLVVAVFGWRETGEILVLENTTTDWRQPQFTSHRVDPRTGAIHVPVIDLNADGKPDFVALVAQEHEQVCAFINQGDFKFVVEILYSASQPGYGSSGIQLVDLDGDNHVDVLYSNGDVLDSPHLLKPYHSVQWLRNKGGERLEFEHRPIGAMYGVHRAVAGDVTGDGRLDVVAVSYLPKEQFPQHEEQELDAIVVFEQTTPGEFVRHKLASRTSNHVTCALGDVFGTGKMDIVTANFMNVQAAPTLHVLENQGAADTH
jgi:hypothetical protein